MAKKILSVSLIDDAFHYLEIEKQPAGFFVHPPPLFVTQETLRAACQKADEIYLNGFCGGDIDQALWTSPMCKDADPASRHCGPYHANAGQCPPGATWVGTNAQPPDSTPYYDVEDYARDMIDQVALTSSTNPNEPIRGNDVTIYSIGLGYAAWPPSYAGEEMLRYMANVGDDGSRLNDPCDGAAHQTHCGNYYYAPNASFLAQIFENIARTIYTRISK